jgi:hypothetical protein
MPIIAWHGLDRMTREEHLARWGGLATDAAACTVLDDQPARAVELLEQGRSVLWNQTLNMQGDLDRLAATAPPLAARLNDIRRALDTPAPGAPSGIMVGPAREGGGGAS